MSPRKRTCGPGLLQRLIWYGAVIVGGTPGGRVNRPAAREARPREPDRGPAAGVSHLGHHLGARPRIHEGEGMDAAGTTWVGIDVSKAALDACQLGPGGRTRHRAFPNTPAG